MAHPQRKHATHEEAEETRRTILRVAQELFMELGYRSVTTRQIADACGLTQPALYHYFADKQELYVAMAHEELTRIRTALERIAVRKEDFEERLKRMALYLISSTLHDINPMLHDIRHELSLAHQSTLYVAFRASIVSPISTVFGDGLSAGQMRDQQHGGSDAETASFLFMSLISNAITRKRNNTSQINDVEFANFIVHTLLHGLAKP